MMISAKTIFDLVDEEQEIEKSNKEEPKENIEQINIEEEIKTNPRIKNLNIISTLSLVAGTINTLETLSMMAYNYSDAETFLTGLTAAVFVGTSIITTKQIEEETKQIKEQYKKTYKVRAK